MVLKNRRIPNNILLIFNSFFLIKPKNLERKRKTNNSKSIKRMTNGMLITGKLYKNRKKRLKRTMFESTIIIIQAISLRYFLRCPKN
jgi:hypothetical protein